MKQIALDFSRMNSEEIKNAASDVYNEAVRIRRLLHQNPELGYEEYETSAIISEYLKSLKMDVIEGVAGTGVIGILQGDQSGPVIALRADMDALPIHECSGVHYASINQGKMHACGHDMHMAMLLAAACVLSGRRADLAGTVKFIFQPAEEALGGAERMIREGVLDTPSVDYIFGFHVWPDLKSGLLGFRGDAIMASMDTFDIVLTGKQAHGAAPHKGIDAIIAASQLITAIQTIVSREVNPLDSVVITVGRMEGGTAYNIIPEKVSIKGTVRALNPAARKKVAEQMERVVYGLGSALGVQADYNYKFFYPVTRNNNAFTTQVAGLAEKIFGEASIQWLAEPSMASEDFSFFLEKVPGTFVFLGVNNEASPGMKLHSEFFNPDEEAMRTGIALLLAVGLSFTP